MTDKKWPNTMSDARWRFVELDIEAKLTIQERQEGWHFCDEWDGMLTQGEERNDDGSCAHCKFDGRKVGDDGNYRN